MKKVTLTISIFIQCMCSFAQKEYEYVPFPTSDAIWSEVYRFGEYNWQPPSYERFAVNGEDTIINGKTYYKIYMFLNNYFDVNLSKYVGALREDEQKRIWLKMDTPVHQSKPANVYNTDEILLYDFSVNEGDTIKSEYLNLETYNEGAIVFKIDTIQIGNTYRKKIKLRFPFDLPDDFPFYDYREWIEGIGSINGLFFTSRLITTTGGHEEQNYLIGFKYQDEILYFDEKYSDFYPTNIKKVISNKIPIISISGTDIIFEFEEKDNNSVIQIFNMTGILQTTLQNEFILNINMYSKGIYIYKAVDNFGNSYVGKFIIR